MQKEDQDRRSRIAMRMARFIHSPPTPPGTRRDKGPVDSVELYDEHNGITKQGNGENGNSSYSVRGLSTAASTKEKCIRQYTDISVGSNWQARSNICSTDSEPAMLDSLDVKIQVLNERHALYHNNDNNRNSWAEGDESVNTTQEDDVIDGHVDSKHVRERVLSMLSEAIGEEDARRILQSEEKCVYHDNNFHNSDIMDNEKSDNLGIAGDLASEVMQSISTILEEDKGSKDQERDTVIMEKEEDTEVQVFTKETANVSVRKLVEIFSEPVSVTTRDNIDAMGLKPHRVSHQDYEEAGEETVKTSIPSSVIDELITQVVGDITSGAMERGILWTPFKFTVLH